MSFSNGTFGAGYCSIQSNRWAGLRVVFIGVLLLACTAQLQAQPDQEQASGSEAPAATTESPDATTTEPVIVTATRVETPTSKVGSSVTVIDSKDLKRRQQTQAVDALRFVPGIQVRRSGGPGSVTSIFTRGTDADHTLFLVDGVPIHDVASPTGAAAIDHLLVNGVDRIEAIRGPQSTLYGSDAIGGVINVLSQKGEGPPTFTVSAEFGSYATYIERGSVSGSDDLFNYSAHITRIDSQSISSAKADSETDPYRNTSISTRFGIEPSDEFTVDFFIHYIDADVEFDSGTNFGISQTESEQFIFKIEPRIILLDGVWEQKFSIWAHTIDRENAGTGFAFPSDFLGTNVGVDWQNNFYIHEQHTITFGVEYEHQDGDFSAAGTAPVEANAHNFGFYLQDQITFNDRLSGTIGIRVDSHSEFGTEVTYRAAGVYHHLETNTYIRATVGTGFKAPTLSELYDTSFLANNPSLEPETTTGFDIGFEQRLFEDMVIFGATYFYNDIDDLILAAPPAFRNVNIDQARTQGMESFLRLQPVDNVLIQFTYTYTDTRAENAPAAFGLTPGSRLLRRPLHSFSADISIDFLDDRANATLTILYIGERDDLNSAFAVVNADDHVTVNLSGSFQVTDQLEIFGRVENLFNHNYQEVLTFSSPGVSAFGGFRFTF